MSFSRPLPLLALAAALAAPLAAADAQGFMDRLKKKAEETAKRKVEERVDQRAGEATDRTIDRTEGALKCVVTDRKCIERAKRDGEEVVLVDESGAAVDESGAPIAPAAPRAKPGEGAWRNYDFVPGDRVVFADDFSREEVGDFPTRLELGGGNFEVVEWEGRRFLSTNTWGEFSITLPERLPERFTLEFDYSADGGNYTQIYFGGTDNRNHVAVGEWTGGVDGAVRSMGVPSGDEYRLRNTVFPVRVMVDGAHVKVYMDDTRVANVPKIDLGRSTSIRFVVPGTARRAALIGDIRIAAGGRKLYDALAAKGRVSTQGILFDTGSDVIRPESTPTLTEIGRMLSEHPALALVIEGHTDDVGDAAANQALSERRAQAVLAHLVSAHAIDAARLEAKGLGASRPAVPNTTPEGRRQNRRVELVKKQ